MDVPRALARFTLVDGPSDGTNCPIHCAVRSSSGHVMAEIVDKYGSEMWIAQLAKNGTCFLGHVVV